MSYLQSFILLIVLFFHSISAAQSKPALISLDFQEIEVRKALHILAKFVGTNILIEETVQGKISLNFSQVPPEEAIQAILKLKNLTQERMGTTWLIQTQSKMSAMSSSEGKTHLEIKRFVIKHRTAQEIATLFLGKQTEKRNNKLSIDVRSNSLWVQDTPARIKHLEQIIQWFDRPIRQILIEARIVSVLRDYNQTIGMQLGFKPIANSALLSTNPKALSTAASLEEQQYTINTPQTNQLSSLMPELNFNLPIDLNSIFSQMTSSLFNNIQLLDLELSALENEGTAHILSKPRLMTTDRETAIIEAGSEIPYYEKNQRGITTIRFKKAVLSLKVTPEITPLGKILLKLHILHNKPGVFQMPHAPNIDTQELKTQVLIGTGETIVLGGIYENILQNSTKRLPILGTMPFIGALFRHKTKINKSTELLIFITPSIQNAKPVPISDTSITHA